jgi:NADPH:quinone reductase-like Zn-dependent oxidoreductase
MKAIVSTKYGGPEVLQLKELPRPEPKGNEVQIRVVCAGVNAGDWHLMRGDPFLVRLMFGLRKLKFPILGSDVAGIVERVGPQVTKFSVGESVFGDISQTGFGAYSEFVCAPEDVLVHKPEQVSFEKAAATPVSGVTALQALRDIGHIQTGEHVLINGASGGVGSFAVQIARSKGADVTAVCSSRKWEYVKGLKPTHMINYQTEDFTRSGKKYDIILAANGYHPLRRYARCLNKKGRYVMVGGKFKQMMEAMILGPLFTKKEGKQFRTTMASANHDDLLILKSMLEKGSLKPTIDRTFPLEEVPEAISYLEQGAVSGKVVIKLQNDG